MNPQYRIELQPQLVEEAVLRAIAGHREARLFWEGRDRLYEDPDRDDREKAFQSFNRSWFNRLGLDKPLREVLALWPILTTSTSHCVLIKARSKKDAGAELFLAPQESGLGECERRTIAIQLTPELLSHSKQLLDFLRHELFHLVDMLDPNFGYEPDFPKSEAGPAYDHLLLSRYGVLWDITIDGRLCSYGWLPASVREKHFALFKRTFFGAEEKLEKMFSCFFDEWPHAHRELMDFAVAPEKWLREATAEISSKGRCAICHFPTFHLINPSELRVTLLAKIQANVPSWNPSKPVCRQCVDLYEARVSSADLLAARLS